MPTENQIDCPALHERCTSYPFGDRVPRTVRMLKTVIPDPMPGIDLSYIKGETPVAKFGQTYYVWTNSHGAVSAVMGDGARLGLRPAEFEVESWHQLATDPVEQLRGKPVALPAYKLASAHNSHDWDQGHRDGWGSCLDEVAKLGPLYAHTDAGEVEQLVSANSEYARRHLEQQAEVERLRSIERSYDLREELLTQVKGERDRMIARTLELAAQLAERDALFARILGKRDACAASYWFDEIEAVLSASAEPSANIDLQRDRSYRDGLMAGFGFGINGDEAGYQRSLASYQREIVSASAAPSALPDPFGCNKCTHPECGKFEGPRHVECRAMAVNACASLYASAEPESKS